MVRPLQSPVVWSEMTTPCHPTIAGRLRLPLQIQDIIASLSAYAVLRSHPESRRPGQPPPSLPVIDPGDLHHHLSLPVREFVEGHCQLVEQLVHFPHSVTVLSN